VNVLNLEVPTGRLHTHKHPTVDGNSTDATMRAGERAANDNPFSFNHRIDNGQLDIRKCALDILENRPHTRTANLPTVVSGIFGKNSAAASMSPRLNASCCCYTTIRLALEAAICFSPVPFFKPR